MLRLGFSSLWTHRRRLIGTGIAISLGVAFLTGTLVLGDTLSHNFDTLFREVSAGTDVVVRNATTVDSSARGVSPVVFQAASASTGRGNVSRYRPSQPDPVDDCGFAVPQMSVASK